MADPTNPSVSYNAMWWDGVPLHLVQNPNGGPDPLAQGAVMVALSDGSHVGGHDWCFGCGAIEITNAATTAQAITITFDTPGLATSDAGLISQAAVDSSLTYSAACTSGTRCRDDATGRRGADHRRRPHRRCGLPVPGDREHRRRCRGELTDDGSDHGSDNGSCPGRHADTRTADIARPDAHAAGGGTDLHAGTVRDAQFLADVLGRPASAVVSPSSSSSDSPRPLAFTGAAPMTLAVLGTTLTALGLGAVFGSRRRRFPPLG